MPRREVSEALERALTQRTERKKRNQDSGWLDWGRLPEWFSWIQKAVSLVLGLWAMAGIAIWLSESQDRENDRAARIADLVSRAQNVIDRASADKYFHITDLQARWALETLAQFGHTIRIDAENGIDLDSFELDCGTIILKGKTVHWFDGRLRNSSATFQAEFVSLERMGAIGSWIYPALRGQNPTLNLNYAALDDVHISSSDADWNGEPGGRPREIQVWAHDAEARHLYVRNSWTAATYDWVSRPPGDTLPDTGCTEYWSSGEQTEPFKCPSVGTHPGHRPLYVARAASFEPSIPPEPLRPANCAHRS